jgi:DNA repair protein RecO (recombination protein O)
MPLLKLTGFVLRTRSWGEADKLATFFTKERGKLFGVVRGARKPQSHWGGALEPLTMLDLLFYEKSGRHTLTQCEIIRSFHSLRQPGPSGSASLYILELVENLTVDEDANPQLFNEMERALRALEEGVSPLPLLNSFRLKLLTLLGFWPWLDTCVSCGKKIKGMILTFNPKSGGLVCPDCKGSLQGNLTIGEKTLNRTLSLLNLPYSEIKEESEDQELNEILVAFLGAQLGMEVSKVKSYMEKLENGKPR